MASPDGAQAARCKATTKGGQACRSFAVSETGYCLTHDPERRDEAEAARAKGGRMAGRVRVLQGQRARLDTVPALVAFTGRVIHEVLEGRLPFETARVVIYGLNLQRQLVEVSDLGARLDALEARLAAAPAPAGGRRWGV